MYDVLSIPTSIEIFDQSLGGGVGGIRRGLKIYDIFTKLSLHEPNQKLSISKGWRNCVSIETQKLEKKAL
jgi:hypothetical protein